MLLLRRIARPRNRDTAKASMQRSGTWAADCVRMRRGIRDSTILRFLRRCGRTIGADSVRDTRRFTTADRGKPALLPHRWSRIAGLAVGPPSPFLRLRAANSFHEV